MARERSKEPEDQHAAPCARRTPAPGTRLSESDGLIPSAMLTSPSPRALHTLQRTVGNRAVVGMISKAGAVPSIQREGERARSGGGGNRLFVGRLSVATSRGLGQG